jgi:hypothetical protein
MKCVEHQSPLGVSSPAAEILAKRYDSRFQGRFFTHGRDFDRFLMLNPMSKRRGVSGAEHRRQEFVRPIWMVEDRNSTCKSK